MDLLEISLSVVVARFWPVLLEYSDSCQFATGWIYLWMLWIVAVDCISATTLLLRFHYSFQFFGVKKCIIISYYSPNHCFRLRMSDNELN